MPVSGVLVVSAENHLATVRAALSGLNGVEVHHVDPPTGRMVITIEAGSVEEEIETLTRVQGVEGVVLAELVHHHFEDSPIEPASREEVPSLLGGDPPHDRSERNMA